MSLSDSAAKQEAALTVQDAAAVLKVGEDQVKALITAGDLPSFRIGRLLRIDPQIFADWLRARAVKPKFEPLATRQRRIGRKRNG